MQFTTQFSDLDKSVNFIADMPVGKLEARYVRRVERYFIAYLSSQTGCAQQCAMCHLTATNQRKFENTTVDQYYQQAVAIFEHYATQMPAMDVHYNYMARGEPLNNIELIENHEIIFNELNTLAYANYHVNPRHNISTIMPAELFQHNTLLSLFKHVTPYIYYSLYSLDPAFRNKWLPKACDPYLALDMLAEWQQKRAVIPKIHYAFIEGENDSEQSVIDICNELIKRQLIVNINVVRYNPYSDRYGKESSIEVIDRNADIFKSMLNRSKVKIIEKVGQDVKASCGMFVGGNRKIIGAQS
jgi:23S rRNA (adenine2503-C2)-methyltransferase